MSAAVHGGLLAAAAIALASTGAVRLPRSVTTVFTDVSVPELEEARPAEPEAPDVTRADEEIDLLLEPVEPELAYVSLEPAVQFEPAATAVQRPWDAPGADARVGPPREAVAARAPATVPSPAPVSAVPDPTPDREPNVSAAVPQSGNAAPNYPSLARRRGWTGAVVLAIDVSAGGEVVDVRVAESSGRDVLDRAAREAALNWRYEPAAADGVPIATTVRRTVRFELR